MTFPLLSSTYTDPELVTSANLYSRVLAVINTLGGFLYGEDEDVASVTLSTTGTNFILPNVAVTFTLTQQRRVRIAVGGRYTTGGATAGNCQLQAAYVAGNTATLTGATILGNSGSNQTVVTASGGGTAQAMHGEHSALLAAGQWTCFAVASRATGGNASDTASLGYCAVYDAGNV